MPEQNTPKPDVNAIVQELRQGMSDTEILCSDNNKATARRQNQAAVRKTVETADVLGRCGGSVRGKLCLWLAKLAWPVVEQLNMHHQAVVDALNQQNELLEERLKTLEDEIDSLRQESMS